MHPCTTWRIRRCGADLYDFTAQIHERKGARCAEIIPATSSIDKLDGNPLQRHSTRRTEYNSILNLDDADDRREINKNRFRPLAGLHQLERIVESSN
ncbi:hypothetical protein RvY_14522 [Ramazzottius varieornatus]|uniref:Uncharacterized protein n=1 Tax=Ramazzottius varieornatus TaxID=947166 RepID=A0A1D1VRQ9_RAMVA|nr:hypothetical protein RvY_14522 [Ramazzottius varieornatus]